jgi:histidine decarboxylase
VLDSARPAGDDRLVSYTGSLDETVTGSRSGHAPLMLWWAWQVWGLDGLRQRAATARALAAATTARLDAIGWPAWRHPLAFTVVLDRPSRTVLDQWPLGVDGNRAHLVCMPGKTTTMLDAFVADLHHVVTGQAGPVTAAAERPHAAVPGPRTQHLPGPALAPHQSAGPC